MKFFQNKKQLFLASIAIILLGFGVIYTNCGSGLEDKTSQNNKVQSSINALALSNGALLEGVRTVLKPKTCSGIGLEPLPGYELKIIDKNKVGIFKNEGGMQLRIGGGSVSCGGCTANCQTRHDGSVIFCEGGPCEDDNPCQFEIHVDNVNTTIESVK